MLNNMLTTSNFLNFKVIKKAIIPKYVFLYMITIESTIESNVFCFFLYYTAQKNNVNSFTFNGENESLIIWNKQDEPFIFFGDYVKSNLIVIQK